MKNKPTFMILHASSGSGHTRAAEALVKECENRSDIGTVSKVDALEYTNTLFRDFYAKLYEQMVTRTPDLWRLWYETSNEPWKTDRMRLMLDKLNLQGLAKLIKEQNPDMAICTHFLPAELISDMIDKGEINTRLVIVVTDFYVHAMWLSSVFNRYFVTHNESAVHLQALGFPADRVTVSGIPIDSVFGVSYDRASLCKQYGLNENLPTVLLSAGTFGMESAAAVADALLKLVTPVQVVILCGRNEKLRQRLTDFAVSVNQPFPHFHIEGYTTCMHEWMALADLFIGKPGGLTTAECMASGLPMVIYQPIPGQEEHNSDHLLENGVAIKCSELLTLSYKLDELFNNPDRLQNMREKAKHLGAPRAAQTVIDTLVKHMNDQPSNVHPGFHKR